MKTPINSLKKFFILFTLIGSSFFLVSSVMADLPTTNSSYPLSICVVSGDKLGVMAPPVIVQHDGTEVRFCCKDCLQDFNKDPQKYLKRLNDAKGTQAAKAVPTASQ